LTPCKQQEREYVLKHNYKLAKAVTGALLVLSIGTSTAFAATNAELEKQLEALQQTVEALKQQVQAQKIAEPSTTSEELATKSDVEGVRADLENFRYDQSRQQERGTTKATRDTTLFGAVQTRAQIQDHGGNAATLAGNPGAIATNRNSSFEVPLALLGVRGNLYKDYKEGKDLDYQLSFLYGKRGDGTNNSDFNLADAFVRYNFFSTNGGPEIPRLNVTFGQQIIPFGLEAQAPEELRPTINVATAPAQLGLFNRQIGAIVRGDIQPFVDYGANYRAPLVEYAFGVVNGNSQNKLDNNNGKDYLGRVALTLPVDYTSWFRELKVGASFYKGDANVQNFAKTAVLKNNGKSDRYGFDIYYNHAPYGATYEYFQGRTDVADAANNIGEARSEGHTLTLFYTFGDQFFNSVKSSAKFDDWWPQSYQPFYRYDYFNQKCFSTRASSRYQRFDNSNTGCQLVLRANHQVPTGA
jgi:hypothetical protein